MAVPRITAVLASLIFVTHVISKNVQGNPCDNPEFPNPYHDGHFCCKYNKESKSGMGECYGRDLSLTSKCCKHNDYCCLRIEHEACNGKPVCSEGEKETSPTSYYYYDESEAGDYYIDKNNGESYYVADEENSIEDGDAVSNLGSYGLDAVQAYTGNYNVASPSTCTDKKFPFSYYNGNFCCKFSTESNSEAVECHGGDLLERSRCCLDNSYCCVRPDHPACNGNPVCGGNS